MESTTRSTYDDIIYQGHPFSKSHPDRLSTIGNLFGMKPAPVTKCRVLELGCGTGGNIIPMASNLPDSNFVGVELSSRQVEMSKQIISEIDLQNIEIKNTSVMDIDDSWGEFDYIIAHGLYSWVSEEVQNKILNVCSDNLSRDGIAYVSYNTYPGWHYKQMIRKVMLFHTAQFSEPKQKIDQARAVVNFLAGSVPSENNFHGMTLKKELELIRKVEDYYLFHDYLEEQNRPVYFHEFIENAGDFNLQYLGEASFRSMLMYGFPKNTVETMKRISAKTESTEQYMDFLKNTAFRSTLLCHKDQEINHNVDLSGFSEFLVSLSKSPNKRPVGFSPDTDYSANAAGEKQVKIRHPLSKATIAVLCDFWPAYVDVGTLFKEAVGILIKSGGKAAAVQDQPSFMRELFLGYSSGVYEFHTRQPDLVNQVSENPKVNKLAAYQAIKGKPVVNQLHDTVNLDYFEQQLLGVINDTEDMDSLHERLFDLTVDGSITLEKDNVPVTDTETIHKSIKDATRQALSKLANAALLIK